MLLNRRVVLRTFNGATRAPENEDPACNYWSLVGSSGTVVKTVPGDGIDDDRVLVQFDLDVEKMGLHCHNEIYNSLWIKRGDLVVFG